MLVISPFAKHNFVDHKLSDQSSIINLIEYNWRLPGIAGSADEVLAKQDLRDGLPFDLANMFSFVGPLNRPLPLDPTTGEPNSRL